MGQVVTIGLDIAKSGFQVHGVDESGAVIACATAHHWARELIKLGHQIRLMPPSYVKP
jgi:transposase